MVPRPFFETEFRTASSFTSVDDDGKIKQRVLALYGLDANDKGKKMPRKRVCEGLFQPHQGLVGNDFYHTKDTDAIEQEYSDRAVLLQSVQNYRKIALNGFKDFPENDLHAMQDPRFGEQLIVDADSDICIGDIYEVVGSTLKLRVTSPRKASRYLDQKNKTKVGVGGMAHFTVSSALCGWFCEVLCEGTIGEGSELVLMERPQPKWTLTELAKAVYGGEGNKEAYLRMEPSWGRSQEELKYLISLPYLGRMGWKEKMLKIQRLDEQRSLPTPYLAGLLPKNKNAVGSVLGVYGRDDVDFDDFMPRAQIEEASFAPVVGLEDSEFYHIYDDEVQASKKKARAVLVQTIQSYRKIANDPKFPLFPTEDLTVLLDPRFGEQIILDIPNKVCLGDVYAVTGSTLRLLVSSPRKPCMEIDNRNSVPYGSKGLRNHTCSRALAGFFCEVVTEGTMVKGSTFELVERPYPQWSMEELSLAIFGGEGNPKALMRGTGSWGRPMEQLHALIANPCLADWEWKDELRDILKRMEKKAAKEKATQAPTRSISHIRRRPISLLSNDSVWIPILFAFIIATISCTVVMAVENSEEEDL